VALHTIKQTNYINITNADFDDKDLSAFPGDEKKNIVQHFTF
jgi:hypothetical protein